MVKHVHKTQTLLFGEIYTPSKFSQILEIIDDHSGDRRSVYMWRGQGDVSWAIHSSAYRRLLKERRWEEPPSEMTMRDYERDLLLNAWHQGYGYENGRKLTDFELLAKLQHHGAATRLIDVSRNMLVALWFACRSQTDKTGILLGWHISNILGFEGRSEERGYNEIFGAGDTKGLDTGSHPVVWQPPVVTKRIAAQSAEFLYSRVCDDPVSSLAFKKEKKAFLAIGLTPQMKSVCLRILEDSFDVRQLTLFPDIDGFGYANSENFGRYSNERW